MAMMLMREVFEKVLKKLEMSQFKKMKIKNRLYSQVLLDQQTVKYSLSS